MPYKIKEARRQKFKARYRVKNWREYGNCQDWRHGVESGPSAGILSGCMPPMTCPYCPSRPISKRLGTTDLGYGVFRCSACRRKFNERTGTPFNWICQDWLS